MVRSRLGLKILGLCAVLVGMFAFSSTAQAEVNAFWKVSGAKIASTLNPPLEAKVDVVGTLLTTLGGQFIDLTCQTIKTAGSAHLVEPLGKVEGKLDFGTCDFLSLKEKGGVAVLQKACEPSAEGVKGLIVTNAISGLIKLHKTAAGVTEAVLEATPKVAGPFVTILLGEECAFGETLKVGGTGAEASGGVFFLKDCETSACTKSSFTTDKKEHLVTELTSLTKLTVNGGATVATIDGSAWAFLGGATHSGLTFAGQPG